MHRYLVVIEKADGNFSAYCPDVPGCIATGGTREEAKTRMQEALRVHIQGMVEDGEQIPDSEAVAEYMVLS